MRTLDLPPYAPTLIESTRSLGYSLESAVADIIDNSISANAEIINLNYYPGLHPYIYILDNGTGMNAEELNRAMQYGSQNPNNARDSNDLGRFGLGLKTASISQCRSLTVLSKKNGLIEGRRWDLDYVAQQQSWALQILEPEEMEKVPGFGQLDKNVSGTLVVWENLDRLKEGEKNFEDRLSKRMKDVEDHLSLVFHRFLKGEKGLYRIQIRMNGIPVEPADPFLEGKSQQTMPDEIIHLRGEEVVVKPYLLPHVSKMTVADKTKLGGTEELTKNQGFYIYRNKRLIIWGTWFRLAPINSMSQLARIQVDIPNTLDTLWTLDVKKSTAYPPEEIKKNLENLVPKLTEKSKKTWSIRGKRELNKKNNPIWERIKNRDGSFSLKINRDHTLLVQLLKGDNADRDLLEALLMLIENNIPYNQIFTDLSENEQPETEISETEVKEILLNSLQKVENHEMKKLILESIQFQEPYSKFPKIIEKVKGEL